MTLDKTLVRIRFFLAVYFYSLICCIVEGYYRLKRYLLDQPLFGTTRQHQDLSGCVCLISGAAGGSIGRIVIRKLAKRNCFLIIPLHGSKEFAEQSKKELLENELKGVSPSLYRFEYLDLLCFDSVIRFVKKLEDENQKINFFISNSGIALKDYRVTEDGFESQMQVNHLGGCLLLIGLLPLLVKTARLAKENNEPKSKIVFTNSCSHRFVRADLKQLDYASSKFEEIFSTHKIYPSSKLFQLLFNLHFYEHMIKRNGLSSLISFINIHPGVVDTGLYNDAVIKTKLTFLYYAFSLIMKRPEEGAVNVSGPILSSDKFFDSTDCLYLEDLQPARVSPECHDEKLREKVYRVTLSLLKANVEKFGLPKKFNPCANLEQS